MLQGHVFCVFYFHENTIKQKILMAESGIIYL